jgi:glutamate-ammonia-ligase adenylyltransferase
MRRAGRNRRRMTTRSSSPARLGVGAALIPRLEALGWIIDGHPTPSVETLLRAVRSGPDPDGALQRLVTLAERSSADLAGNPGVELARLAGASRGLWDSLLRHPEWISAPVDSTENPRELVQRRTIEIALADLHGRWDLSEVARALSDLADEAAALALHLARRDSRERFPEVDRLAVAIIALGKWGGRELNYASDIDLLFVYDPGDVEPDLARRLANRLAVAFIDALSRPTAEGIALRVDADLRPEGSTGPLIRTLDSYRGYYEKWGEAWEFQALLKARPAAGDDTIGLNFMEMVSRLVWPASLHPDSVRVLRQLKAKAEEAADPDDIKRSPGGIRDVEFSVQLLQLVHGRFDAELRSPGTLEALDALVAGDYVRTDDAQALAESYRFLRTVEHRLQMWQMSQTHRLPPDREHLALAMGYRSGERTAADLFNADLTRHRTQVRTLHQRLYYRPLLEAFAASPAGVLSRERAATRLRALGFVDVEGAAQAIEDLTAGLSRRSRLMQQLLPLMVDWLADTPNPDLGLNQLAMLVAASPDSAELTGTLRDRPIAGQRLCALLGTSRMVGSYLDRIPEFLPRLADDLLLLDLPNGEEVIDTALERMKLRTDHASRISSLRRLVRRRMLRVAAADLLDMVDLDRVTSALTDTANAAATAALWTATEQVGETPLAVIAMGKWGGRELGYGSDLDLIYAVKSTDDAASGLRLAGEFAAVLGSHTPDGVAYVVDASLRPEGKQGSLARSLEAYRSYYEQRAAPWERLALIRARPVAGDEKVMSAFADLISIHAYPERINSDMVRSIRHIKARVEKERLPRGEDSEFHLKLGRGSLSDIEFLAQLWQLRLGHRHPELQTSSTLAALGALGGVGVLSEGEAEHLAATYRLCTKLRNRLFLQTARPHDSLPIDDELARLAQSLGYENRADLREEYRRMTRRTRKIFDAKFYED